MSSKSLAALARLTVVACLAAAPAAATDSVGLSPVGAEQLRETASGGAGPQSLDFFGAALAAGDLDGDGFEDLAVGVPADDGPLAAPAADAGVVLVFFGGAEGVDPGAAPRRLAQVGSEAEAGDFHGNALAACDFNDDDFDDLAVGAPLETVAGIVAAGAVLVYPGSATGPQANGPFSIFTQENPGVPGIPEFGDLFGAALACGDFDRDGFDDLAIGVPGEDVGAVSDAGFVVVLFGSSGGLGTPGVIELSQLTPDIESEPEAGDGFGRALAVGDLDGDTHDDLAIGVPGEDLGCGAVHLLRGVQSGLTGSGSALWTDDSFGGLAETGDQFGATLVFGSFDGGDLDDLVIGIPRETFATASGPVPETGQVVVVYGVAVGNPTDGIYWAENNLFGSGTSEPHDRFGSALAAADFDRDGFGDLAVGHPGETIAGEGDGSVTVVNGSSTGVGAHSVRRFSPGLEGVPGAPPPASPARRFGAALAVGDFDGDGFPDLALGAPDEEGDGAVRAGAATVLYGALFADGFECDDPFGPWETPPVP